MKLNLGIVGFGGMGQWHYEHAGKLEDVNVVAVCDIDKKRLNDARALGLKTYSNYNNLVYDTEINTVLVSVPNHLHKEVAIAAANAKKNIIVEKPVALNTDELAEMEKYARANNIIFTVHQNRRWDIDYRTAKKVFEEKMLGEVFTIESNLSGVHGLIHDWHQFKEAGGGMIYDWGVHLFDQILDMVPGKVETVFANLKSIYNLDIEDYYRVILRFYNGIDVQINLGTFLLEEKPRWYIAGDKGTLVINGFGFKCRGKITRTNKIMEKLPPKIVATTKGPTRVFASPEEGQLYTEKIPEVDANWLDFFKNYINVLNGKEELIIKLSEVKRVLKLMEAVFRSSETGEAINFE